MIASSLPFYLKCQWSPLNIICVQGMWKELSTITKFISGFKVEPKFGIFKSQTQSLWSLLCCSCGVPEWHIRASVNRSYEIRLVHLYSLFVMSKLNIFYFDPLLLSSFLF